MSAVLILFGFGAGRAQYFATERHLRERLALKDDQLLALSKAKNPVPNPADPHSIVIRRIEAKQGIMQLPEEMAQILAESIIFSLISFLTPVEIGKTRLLIRAKRSGSGPNGSFEFCDKGGLIVRVSQTLYVSGSDTTWHFPISMVDKPLITIISPVDAGTITKLSQSSLVFEKSPDFCDEIEVKFILIGFNNHLDRENPEIKK